jgi:hypothetical protein
VAGGAEKAIGLKPCEKNERKDGKKNETKEEPKKERERKKKPS